MPRSSGPPRLKQLTVRIATAMLAAWYVVLVLGIPLPAPRKATSERFPCENCHCGCSSAQQCWSNCCCHTIAERLAWAKREGVEPPPFVCEFVLEQNVQSVRCDKKEAAALSTCCGALANSTPGTLCGKTTGDKAQRRGARGKTGRDYVLAWRALACHGTVVQWTDAAPAIITPVDLPALPDHAEWLLPSPASLYEGIGYDPLVPPPRRAFAS